MHMLMAADRVEYRQLEALLLRVQSRVGSAAEFQHRPHKHPAK